MANLYEILEVDRSAGPEELARAFHKLAGQLHHLKWRSTGDAERESAARRLHLVEEAYAILSKPELRANYDRTLDNGGDQP